MDKRLFSRILSLIFIFFIASALLPNKVNAASDKELSLICEEGNVRVDGMYWRLYRVGERQNNEFVLTGQFAKFPVSMKNLTDDNIKETSQALESFVIGYSPDVYADGYTDANGTVRFTGLESGIYLAVASKVKKDMYTYNAVPLLAELTEGEKTVFPKVYSNVTLSGEARSFTVKKVWLDHDNAYVSRPVNVTVDLFRDGTPADTVTLDESNNWEYTWTTLDEESDWRVVERNIPRKYAVLVDYNSKQFLIKNSYDPSIIIDGGEEEITTTTIATTTASGADTTVSTTEATSSTSTSASTTSTTTTSTPKLPQTGQLWWPIIPLVAGGFILLIIGFSIKTDKKESE